MLRRILMLWCLWLTLAPASEAGSLVWRARDQVLPEQADSRFKVHFSPPSLAKQAKPVFLEGDALVIQTGDNESAWYHFAGGRLQGEQAVSVEMEVAASPCAGPAQISLSDGKRSVALYPWNGTHLRVKIDDGEAAYHPMPTWALQTYRIELQGKAVRIFVNGKLLQEGILKAPLEELNLFFGDRSQGGGRMEIQSIHIQGVSGNSAEPSTKVTQHSSKWIRARAETGELSETPLPAGTGALVLDVEYLAAAPRQAQLFLEFETPAGKKMVVVSTGLASVSDSSYCQEKLFVLVPADAQRVSLRTLAAPSHTPFRWRRLNVLPVKLVTGFPQGERLNYVTHQPAGQSFANPEGDPVLGICIPVSREFDAAQFPDVLTCCLYSGESEVCRQTVAARQIPYGFDGYAVFLFDTPVAVGTRAHFTVSSNLGKPPYYGWYTFYHSMSDDYPGGTFLRGGNPDSGKDMVFFVFASADR